MYPSQITSLRLTCFLGLASIVVSLDAPVLGTEPPAGNELRFFEEHIRPLLAAKCQQCHGRDKQEGDLRLDSRVALIAGGESGPAIERDDADASLLLEAINYRSLEMPPDRQLDAEQIGYLTRWVQMGAPWPADDPQGNPAGSHISDEDRSFWSFQPLTKPVVPESTDAGWGLNPIDNFILRRLSAEELSPAQNADRVTLIRRASIDLIGLPPTPAEVLAFVADTSPLAYENLIDRLLESPRYGEKWGRHWLDLVRYAESNGHGGDQYRPDAFRYRDYVVTAFNADKPYDRFVMEQLAGDEIAPDDPDALTATGFLRHWIYESNQRKVRLVREIILNDVTEVTGEVFLGMGLSCARCHDHKFDPISRRDYYRLQAFFSSMLARDDVALIDGQQLETRETKQARWEQITRDIRAEIDALERPVRQKAVDRALRMFPQEVKDLYRKPRQTNSPLELQLVALVDRQLRDSQQGPERKLTGPARQRWDELNASLARFNEHRPDPIPYAMVVSDIGPIAPPTRIPGDQTNIEPGFLSVLDEDSAVIEPVPEAPDSTGRRTALARWIVSPSNPLSTRVIVNRIWQYHFGRGLVGTSSDFGRLGETPSHPELLDWLACRFVEDGWSFKAMHRLVMTSATYRQASRRTTPNEALAKDPGNEWLWRSRIRRLDAEQIRDAALLVSGQLDLQAGGPSVQSQEPRRTIYTKVIRNTPDPLLRVFDAPDGFGSVAQRDVTTTPTQALMMINGDWASDLAEAWASRICRQELGVDKRIEWAFRSATGRSPTAAQLDDIRDFLASQAERNLVDPSLEQGAAEHKAWADLCHILLNSNEFLYVD